MKVETHVNGSVQLILIPETDLERAILIEVSKRAHLGKKITISGSDQVTISIESWSSDGNQA